ncbi:MAG: hypothetical protein KGV51_08740 [Moraxellaceae bacterium]|nr:hypothetical protein [Moraxellaceae bacterium]
MKAKLLMTCSAVLLTTACATTPQPVQPQAQDITRQVATGVLTSMAATTAYPNANSDDYKQAAITGATAGLVNSMTPNNTSTVGKVASSALVGLATSAVQKGANSDQIKHSVISGALTGLINATLNSNSQPAPAPQK